MWESKRWKNIWVKGAIVNRGESFQQNLLSNPIGREETFLQTFLVDHVKQQSSVPNFVAVSGNLGGKLPIVDDVLSTHEQEFYPTTSLDENGIEFEFQTDCNYYVDLRQFFWHWSSNLSRDVVTIHTRARKKGAQRWICCFRWNRNRWRRRTRRSSSSYLCKKHNNIFQMLKCT